MTPSLDRPLISSKTGANVGDRILVALPAWYCDHPMDPQPVIVRRIATRDEFIQYWREHRPEAFAHSEAWAGPPPEHYHYLEVEGD